MPASPTRDNTAAMSRLGDLFRQYRVARGLRQDDVAKDIGWPQTEVSRMERAVLSYPTFADVIALGAFYGLTPNDLAKEAGIWCGPTSPTQTDARWHAIQAQLDAMTPAQRDDLLDKLRVFVRAMAETYREESQHRARGNQRQSGNGPADDRRVRRVRGRRS